MYRVFRSSYLQRQQLSTAEWRRIDELEQQFLENPHGQKLGLPFFREKRLNGKRLLYLVYEEERAVLLVMVTDKRYQQEDIALVKGRLQVYYDLVRARLRG